MNEAVVSETAPLGIAIIGLAGRFPQAADLEAFWTLLQEGREAVVPFADETLLAAGVDPTLLQSPAYVKSGTIVPDVDYFDADFFKLSALDAKLADPQHRLLLECVWQALEQAGYPPAKTAARIGLYAGAGENSYQRHFLEPNRALLAATVGEYRLAMLNSADFLATHTAYKLNLTGPAMTVQTACSTSLVAVHMACQSLLNFECDLALAGGVTVFLPQGQGYLYQEGMIYAPDGHCRAFDAQAQGTIGGGGVGVVLLKRLDEALADGDTIHAVILGSAVNNDGADKIGFTAPSVSGQSAVVMEAQAAAGVHPEEISYIEAHGTGTALGDPIEIQALTQAFRVHTQRNGYCAIGSVKTNIGHADVAAGVAGLIKTVLALKHRQLPPSLHFTAPNPQIDFANSPFFVNDRLRPWASQGNQPRCAGVSAFGIGGTNAHVIVAEAPAPPVRAPAVAPAWHLLRLSAKTPTALEKARQQLAQHLRCAPALDLADVAYTLQVGRQEFAYRQIVVCRDQQEAITHLDSPDPQAVIAQQAPEVAPELIWMFPGGGAQYPNMGRALYEADGIEALAPYRAAIDDCLAILQTRFAIDLKPLLFPDAEHLAAAQCRLEQPSLAYPALFSTEYALAKLWLAWGIAPTAMIGHSMGEYMAACLAGVFSLEDALSIVTWRGQLYETIEPGAMLSVYLSEAEVQARLFGDLAIAAVNKQNLCTVSGSVVAIEQLAESLTKADVAWRRVKIAFAGHSPLQEPILAEFRRRLNQVRFAPPTLPFVSNVTGTWIRPEEAMDPAYWVRHLRQTVRFSAGLRELLRTPHRLFLEVGPGQTLQPLVQAHPDKQAHHTALSSLPHPKSATADVQSLLQCLGQLWCNGVAVPTLLFDQHPTHRRIPLPTYPFERQRYWIDAPPTSARATPVVEAATQLAAHVSVVAPAAPALPASRPLSVLEQEVAAVWSQSLGITDIAPDTDFFTLGGDSLLATQVAARLRTQLQVDLDTHSLLQAPTIARLATLIATQRTQPETTPRLPALVVELQAGDPARKPLVLLHPVGGHVYFYRQLVRHLDPQLPVYGICAQGVAGEAEPLTTVAEMARVYTAALQALQPHGPYFLGGASFGGTLAYAMAQHLLTQGETVAFLALIDTPSQGNMPEPLEETVDILFYMLKVGQAAALAPETLRAMAEAEQLAFFLQQNNSAFATVDELKIMLKLFKTNERAMWNYVPPAYPGKLHYFLARERDAFTAQTPAQGWIGLAEHGIEIYTMPGNHLSMNEEPHVQALAKRLEQCLQQSTNS